MFCSNCGAKFPDNAAFCPVCGKKVSVRHASSDQGASAEQAPSAIPQPTNQQQDQQRTQPAHAAQPTGQQVQSPQRPAQAQQPQQQAQSSQRPAQPQQQVPQAQPQAPQAAQPQAARQQWQQPTQAQPQAPQAAQPQVAQQRQQPAQAQPTQAQPTQQRPAQWQQSPQQQGQFPQQAQAQRQGAPQAPQAPQAPTNTHYQAQPQQPQGQGSAGSAPTAGQPSAPAPSQQIDPKTFKTKPAGKKKNLIPIIGAAAALLIALGGGIFFLLGRGGSGSGSQPEVAPSVTEVTLSADVEAAIDDAATIGEHLASEGDEYGEALENLDTLLVNLAKDREVVQGAMDGADADTKAALERADRAIANIEADARFLSEFMAMYDEFSEATSSLLSEDADADQMADDLSTMYAEVADLQERLLAMDVPEHLRQPVDMLANDGLGQLNTTLAYSYQTLYGAATGTGIYTLAAYETDELLTWTGVKATQAGDLLVKVFNEDTSEAAAVLRGTAGTKTEFTCEFVDEISPNLYPSMDSVVNIYGKTRSEQQDVMIEVEIAGFSQKWEERVTMEQGVSFYMIKPSLLPNNQLSDLTKEQTTQINLTITDVATGDVLVKKNEQVKLKSLYSMAWVNNEFGSTAQFDILAWMRPNIDEVDSVNRKANDYMQEWVEMPMAGYQFGDDVAYTLLQVAAIQSAISDYGVQYQMDSYSLTSSDQNVLTPDAVIKKQQGLCIETTLLMASCLKRLGMHPVIILTPGHAQCAVETYAGSANYFLIETTTLPYKVNTKYDIDEVGFYNGLLATDLISGSEHTWTTVGDAEEWATYLDYVYEEGYDEYGGIFIIDCNLMDELDIKGLDV